MNIVYAAPKLNPGARPLCAAIGVFDGIHLGHQQVLKKTLDDAARLDAISSVITFDQHPNVVVAPQSVPLLIYPLEKKLEVLAAMGFDAAYVIRFDKEFSAIPGEKFARDLARDCRALKSLSVGENFMFGFRRSGNVALLEKLGAELQFAVHAVPDVQIDGVPVSSTRIREYIRTGNFTLASALLGRPYSLRGRVMEGQRLGHQLGFPTANLDVTGLQLPPPGVYAAMARGHAAAVNIGHRPTVRSADPQLHVEAHLLDFSEDIYGQALEVAFLEKLRDEKKFPNLEALRAQITEDLGRARLCAKVCLEQKLP